MNYLQMKTYKNLFDKIISFENLLLAHKRAKKGKRFKKTVADFDLRLESNLFDLQKELASHTYQPQGYTTFYVFDSKKRMISAASYRDRVVHHALCNIIQPIFENTFIEDSYANRKGKGTHSAIKRFQSFMQKNDYVLKCDIRKYFPSIDHEKLKQLIRKKIACRQTLWLIDKIIDNSNAQEKIDFLPENELDRKRGLPIGNLTSQYFANIYLNEFDHFIKEKLQVKCYIRYVDDFVLLHPCKATLQLWKKEIDDFLKNYYLRPHPTKSRIIPSKCGISFLGQRVFRDFRLLKSEGVKRFRKKLKKNIQLWKGKRLSIDKFESRLNSWKGHAGQANTYRLLAQVFENVRSEGLNLVKTKRAAWRFLEQQCE